LTVLADPFWGRLPWLMKRRGGNTASKGNQLRPGQQECAPEEICIVGRLRPFTRLISHDI